MAATRLVGTSKTSTRHSTSPCSSFSSAKTVRCVINAAGFNEESKRVCGSGDQRKPAVPLKASVATSDSLMITTKTKPELDRGMGIDKLASLFLKVTDAFLNNVLSAAVKQTPWKFQVQRFIERAIIDCRFFTLFAVGGSLLGSILCFAEGCFLVLESYFKFFYTLSQKPDQAHIMHLVIEAIGTLQLKRQYFGSETVLLHPNTLEATTCVDDWTRTDLRQQEDTPDDFEDLFDNASVTASGTGAEGSTVGTDNDDE